jgi:hypothetical protein
MAEAAASFIAGHGECPSMHYLYGTIPGRRVGDRAETLIPLRTQLEDYYDQDRDDDRSDYYDYDEEDAPL